MYKVARANLWIVNSRYPDPIYIATPAVCVCLHCYSNVVMHSKLNTDRHKGRYKVKISCQHLLVASLL